MSSFHDACGATGPLQWTVERRGAAEVDRLAFDQPFLIVGSDPAAGLQLRDPEVSDRHAYLQLIGGRLFCVDLGSRAGTYVDGRCVRSGWVDQGESIRIGPYRLRLVGGGSSSEAPDAADDADSPLMGLELLHRSIRSSTIPLAAGLTLVGSAADCGARLLDPSVSAYHCSLIETPKGTWVVDLLGRGDVSINGTAASLGRVYEGDEVRVGCSAIRLRPDGADDDEAQALPALVAAADLNPLLADLPPEKAEIARSLLGPIANQFALMQQQMFERLQQAEHERFRALAEFQREQFGALREELEQLHELRQDIDELRGEVKAQGRPPSARDRSIDAAATRPRLGSAAPQAGAPALEPPAAPKVLRMEAS